MQTYLSWNSLLSYNGRTTSTALSSYKMRPYLTDKPTEIWFMQEKKHSTWWVIAIVRNHYALSNDRIICCEPGKHAQSVLRTRSCVTKPMQHGQPGRPQIILLPIIYSTTEWIGNSADVRGRNAPVAIFPLHLQKDYSHQTTSELRVTLFCVDHANLAVVSPGWNFNGLRSIYAESGKWCSTDLSRRCLSIGKLAD